MAYGTDTGLTDYLALTGRTLPTTTTAAIAREYGSLYVDQFETKYRGTAATEDASFPRDLWDTVPTRVENAAYEAGYAWASGVAIFATGGSRGGQVVSEKLDVMAVTYAAPESGDGYFENNMFILPAAYVMLMPFFKKASGLGYAAVVV